MKSLKLNKHMTIALIIGGDLLLLLLGWYLLVSPQRQAAASIGKATQAATAQIADAQSQAQLAAHPLIPKQPEIKTAGLYELAKAMPSVTDMPDMLLELDQVARASGVSVISISPGPPVIVPGQPWSTVTIQLRLQRELLLAHGSSLQAPYARHPSTTARSRRRVACSQSTRSP